MGLLAADDWRAQWIAGTRDGAPASSSASQNLAPQGDQPRNVYAAHSLPIFRRGFQAGKPVARAVLYACGLGQAEFRLNGRKIGGDPKSVMESGTPASPAEGVKFLGMEAATAVYEVGSGTYRFVAAPR